MNKLLNPWVYINPLLGGFLKEVFQKRRSLSKKGGDRRSKLNDDHKSFIRDLVDNDCTITLEAIARKLRESHAISVTKQTVSNCLGSFHYSLKRIAIVPEARNSDEVLTKRQK